MDGENADSGFDLDAAVAWSALAWGLLLLIGFAFSFVLAGQGFSDVYDRAQGLSALEDHLFLMVGTPVVQAISGTALMFPGCRRLESEASH